MEHIHLFTDRRWRPLGYHLDYSKYYYLKYTRITICTNNKSRQDNVKKKRI